MEFSAAFFLRFPLGTVGGNERNYNFSVKSALKFVGREEKLHKMQT
jgi:hypothetical protein